MSTTSLSLEDLMRRAVALGAAARNIAPPNPWVGAVVVSADGERLYEGATEAPGGRHAEIVALDAAGDDARGGTLVVTLEPCSHVGRTAPCTDAIVEAGVQRVIFGIVDPDPHVRGHGRDHLREAGVEVTEGLLAEDVAEQLAPYVHHRTLGRPLVVLKLASTLDGRTAAPDASSQWITGEEARADVQCLRADSGAVVVGAGTVRADDPSLTARTDPPPDHQPLRVVLGTAPLHARVRPCLEHSGDLGELLDALGDRGILQVLIEGGARVAHEFVAAGLVDRYVVYLAPAFMGGDDGAPVLMGPGVATIAQLRRGRFVSVAHLGEDLRLEVAV